MRFSGAQVFWFGVHGVFLYLLWVTFVNSFELQELALGGVCVVASLIGFGVLRRFQPIHFEPRVKWVAQIFRLPALILQGLAVLFSGNSREASLFLAPFDGGTSDGRSRAKQTLAIVFGTVPPNSIIIHIDQDRNQMLLHEMKPTPLPQMLRELEH